MNDGCTISGLKPYTKREIRAIERAKIREENREIKREHDLLFKLAKKWGYEVKEKVDSISEGKKVTVSCLNEKWTPPWISQSTDGSI